MQSTKRKLSEKSDNETEKPKKRSRKSKVRNLIVGANECTETLSLQKHTTKSNSEDESDSDSESDAEDRVEESLDSAQLHRGKRGDVTDWAFATFEPPRAVKAKNDEPTWLFRCKFCR